MWTGHGAVSFIPGPVTNPMKPSRRRELNLAWRIGAAVLLCAAAGISAQTVHKQVDAAGNITFSDRPGTSPSPATVPALDVVNALASNSAMSSRGAAIIDANEAARRLGQAQRELEQGAESLPGEQAHAGVNAAKHRYLRRQEELLRVVELAQRRSDATDRRLRGLP